MGAAPRSTVVAAILFKALVLFMPNVTIRIARGTKTKTAATARTRRKQRNF